MKAKESDGLILHRVDFKVEFSLKKFIRIFNLLLLKIISSPSYYVWRTLVVMQILDFRFLADLNVLGFGESKKKYIYIY